MTLLRIIHGIYLAAIVACVTGFGAGLIYVAYAVTRFRADAAYLATRPHVPVPGLAVDGRPLDRYEARALAGITDANREGTP